MLVALEDFAVRTTEFCGKLWLQVHAAEQVCEAWVRAQRAEGALTPRAFSRHSR
jgi:hypothetical protein